MCNAVKVSVGLVKSDMTVLTYSENLEINTSYGVYHSLVHKALGICVLCQSVRNVCARHIDIYSAEKMLIHKITIALIVIGRNRIVLIKVKGGHVREIYLSVLIHLYKIIVKTYWRRAGRQAKHAVGLKYYLACHKLGGAQRHFLIIIANNYSHF